jgi:hypothetical protein
MNSSNTETNVTNSSLNNYQRTNQQFWLLINYQKKTTIKKRGKSKISQVTWIL